MEDTRIAEDKHLAGVKAAAEDAEQKRVVAEQATQEEERKKERAEKESKEKRLAETQRLEQEQTELNWNCTTRIWRRSRKQRLRSGQPKQQQRQRRKTFDDSLRTKADLRCCPRTSCISAAGRKASLCRGTRHSEDESVEHRAYSS